MTPIENITLSFACSKNPNKMSPCNLGLHCSKCDKTVIDFRNSKLSDLTNELEKHGYVCGLFTKEQVNIQRIPFFTNFRRIVTSFLFSISISLHFNQLKAQNNDNNSSTNNQDTVFTSDLILGEINEIMPIYKDGGDIGLQNFLQKNIKYPSDSVSGIVWVNFTVDTSGNVIDAKIIRGLSDLANNEALRVVRLLEFHPATRFGKKINIKLNFPIKFNKEIVRIKK